MSLRALRWALLGIGALGLLAILLLVSLAEPPNRRGPVAETAPPVLGRAPDFELVNRDGRRVVTADLAGEVWVADFIFTRCGGSCPRMTSRMIRLGSDLPGLRRVSITVDPDYDTPAVLADYAAAYPIDDPRWLFLTGERAAIETVVGEGFKLPIVADPPAEMADADEPILHSDRFVLVDAAGAVRGYYEATEATDYERLLDDVRLLTRGDAAGSGGGSAGREGIG